MMPEAWTKAQRLTPEAFARRKYRLKAVFEGRCAQLDAAKGATWPPDYAARCAYSRGVIRYARARTAWRNFRGWW